MKIDEEKGLRIRRRFRSEEDAAAAEKAAEDEFFTLLLNDPAERSRILSNSTIRDELFRLYYIELIDVRNGAVDPDPLDP